MWHVHRYTEVERVYAPGWQCREVERATVEEVLKLRNGVTTVLSRCCVCGKLDAVEVLGDARKNASSSDSH